MRKLAVLAIVALLAGCGGQQRPRTPDQVINRALRGAPGQAQPSAVVAAELAFARMAREKGQWTAFAEYAADDAVMFVPEPVNAKAWLKGRANPQESVAWQPHQVWMSCDGSLAVTKGAWQRPEGSNGYFTTVWQRQKKGEYRWVMDQGDVLSEPLVEPEFIKTGVSSCDGNQFPPVVISPPDAAIHKGASTDGTLDWYAAVRQDNSRTVVVRMWDGSSWQIVLRENVAGPPAQ